MRSLGNLGNFGLLGLAVALAACTPEPEPDPWCGALEALCRAADRSHSLSAGGAAELARPEASWEDLDGDGIPDLFLGSRSSGLALRWGGDIATHHWLFPRGVTGATPVDLDGDGDLDLLFTTREPAALGLLENLGGRDLRLTPRYLDLDGSPSALWVGPLAATQNIGDTNNLDSYDIMIAISRVGEMVHIPGSSLPAAAPRPLAGDFGEQPLAIRATDLDHDGIQDIVLLDQSGSELQILRDPLGPGAAPERYPTALLPEHLDVVDIDGDGLDDLVVSGRAEGSLWVHRSDGQGGLHDPIIVPIARTAAGFAIFYDYDGALPWVIVGQGKYLTRYRCDAALVCSDPFAAAAPLASEIQWVTSASPGWITALSSTGIQHLRAIVHGEQPILLREEIAPLLRPELRGISVGDLNHDGWEDVLGWTGGGFSGGIAGFLGGSEGLGEAFSVVLPEGALAATAAASPPLVLGGDGAILELVWGPQGPSLQPTPISSELGPTAEVGGILAIPSAVAPRGYAVMIPWWSPSDHAWELLWFGPDSDLPESLEIEAPREEASGRPFLGAADLDGDGRADAVIHWPSGPITVLWGGDGEPPTPETLDWQGATTFGLATLAEVDGRPDPQLVAVTSAGVAAFDFHGRTIAGAQVLGGILDGQALTLVDSDGDGLSDLLRENAVGAWITLRGAESASEVQLHLPGDGWSYIHPLRLGPDPIVDLVGVASGTLVSRRTEDR